MRSDHRNVFHLFAEWKNHCTMNNAIILKECEIFVCGKRLFAKRFAHNNEGQTLSPETGRQRQRNGRAPFLGQTRITCKKFLSCMRIAIMAITGFRNSNANIGALKS